VGESLQAEFATGAIAREDVFITTKLWNTNHRPERVEPAFDASCERLGISYVDLYLIHTPFAFQPGDNLDPRDQKGNIIYDDGVTLLETWRAMESSPIKGKCRAIGLSDVVLKTWCLSMRPRGSNRPWSRLNRIRICLRRSCWSSASRRASFFWPLRHWVMEYDLAPGRSGSSGHRPANLSDPAQVLLAWAIQRGTAVLTTAKTLERIRENYNISEIPEAAVDEINRIQIQKQAQLGGPDRGSRFHCERRLTNTLLHRPSFT
jgi:alcohol dehydrogenase (NADP+)